MLNPLNTKLVSYLAIIAYSKYLVRREILILAGLVDLTSEDYK